MKQRQQGFTLVELLVGFAIMVVLLGLITNIFVSGRQSYDAIQEASDNQQTFTSAFSQMSYELSLAGYRGTDDGAAARTFTGSVLDFTLEANTATPDSITIQYYEDRWLSGGTTTPLLKRVQYSLSNGQLVRTDLTTNPNTVTPIVDGIQNLKIPEFVSKDSNSPLTLTESVDRKAIRGLLFQITLSDDDTVAANNPVTSVKVGLNNIQN
ncbi:MAG: PilW family protein [Trueperaceae bacterium]